MDDTIPFRTWFNRTIIGYAIGNFLLLIMYSTFGSDAKVVQFPIALSYGVPIGILQLNVLRRLYVLNWDWAIGYVVGLLIPFVFVDFVVLVFKWNWSLEIINVFKMAMGGVIVGFFHAKILKKLKYANTYVYAVTNTVAWLANAMLVNYNNSLQSYLEGDEIFLLINGLVIIIMGVVLSFMNALALHYIQHHDINNMGENQENTDTVEHWYK